MARRCSPDRSLSTDNRSTVSFGYLAIANSFFLAFPLDLDIWRSERASDFRFVGYFSEATFRSLARKRHREKVGETKRVSATKTRRYGRANHATSKKVNERPS